MDFFGFKVSPERAARLNAFINADERKIVEVNNSGVLFKVSLGGRERYGSTTRRPGMSDKRMWLEVALLNMREVEKATQQSKVLGVFLHQAKFSEFEWDIVEERPHTDGGDGELRSLVYHLNRKEDNPVFWPEGTEVDDAKRKHSGKRVSRPGYKGKDIEDMTFDELLEEIDDAKDDVDEDGISDRKKGRDNLNLLDEMFPAGTRIAMGRLILTVDRTINNSKYPNISASGYRIYFRSMFLGDKPPSGCRGSGTIGIVPNIAEVESPESLEIVSMSDPRVTDPLRAKAFSKAISALAKTELRIKAPEVKATKSFKWLFAREQAKKLNDGEDLPGADNPFKIFSMLGKFPRRDLVDGTYSVHFNKNVWSVKAMRNGKFQLLREHPNGKVSTGETFDTLEEARHAADEAAIWNGYKLLQYEHGQHERNEKLLTPEQIFDRMFR